jgi:hypothetical protein
MKKGSRDPKVQSAMNEDILFLANVRIGWEPILDALANAQKAFSDGGPANWKVCIEIVGYALEKWRMLEPEDVGFGGLMPTSEQRKAKTKTQMVESLRVTLRHFAHYTPDSSVDFWTGDDALLALSLLGGLIAIRRPESTEPLAKLI